MKIDAPRAWAWCQDGGVDASTTYEPIDFGSNWRVRIVPEATWRKVMAVVKVMEAIQKSSDPLSIQEWGRIDGSIDGLREHERKRK